MSPLIEREMWMRRFGPVLCLALLAVLTCTSVAAADPAITVAATRRDANGAVVSLPPVTDTQGNAAPLLLLGEYVIASGQGFPANQPVMAFLVVQGQAYPLAYQDLTTSITARQAVPMTDATGGFQNFAFTLPVSGQLTGTSGEVQISAGSETARAPVGIATDAATKAGRGDKIAVSIGAGFTAIAAILLFLLLRGLPLYPVGTAAVRRPKEPEAT
jgi:hypothetical protein